MRLENIGKWKVYAIESGFFKLDGGAMMGSVPKALWNKTNPSDRKNRINLALRCLLLDDGENVVLIESGIGNKNSDKFNNMFAIDHRKYTLSNTLSKHGYLAENITHVILTHMHFDHAGGVTKFDKEGRIMPAFPNAQYFISKSNWDAAINPTSRDSASYLLENYMALEEYNVLNIIPENSDIIDGIETYVVNGHTTGQQLIKIFDKKDVLVFCSDLIPLKSHIKLPWIMGYDLNASLTLQEKKIFLDLASKYNWILFLYHDPEIAAVKIKKNNKYYKVIDELRRNRN